MIITLTGGNDFSLQAAARELRDAFVNEHTSVGLEQYDGAELDPQKLPSIIQALPFLASKRMVILRNPSAQKALQEMLEKQLDTVPDTTELIIIEQKPDKRTSYYKALQKQTDFRDFKELDEHQLAQWLVQEAKQAGGSLSSSDANYLVQRVGANQLFLSHELQKLLSYQPTITRASIDELTDPLPQSSIFDLLDAALAGNQKKVLQLYHEQRQQKVEPLAIMAMLTWQLHVLALIKTAGDRSAQDIATDAKVSPFVLRKSMNVASRCSLTQLKQWVADATKLDQRLKSQPIDADDALQEYLLSLA
jgi:DNA polymerase-3 subunit delta